MTRWVLVWFALSLGVAMASPLVNPRSLEMVCSGMGVMTLIVHTGDASTELRKTLSADQFAQITR